MPGGLAHHPSTVPSGLVPPLDSPQQGLLEPSCCCAAARCIGAGAHEARALLWRLPPPADCLLLLLLLLQRHSAPLLRACSCSFFSGVVAVHSAPLQEAGGEPRSL